MWGMKSILHFNYLYPLTLALVILTSGLGFPIVSWAQNEVKISIPNDLFSYQPHEIYKSRSTDDPHDPYVFPTEDEIDHAGNNHTNQLQLVDKVDRYTNQLNPQHPTANSILNEWQQLRPLVIDLINKQQEINELLKYMQRLAKVSENQQDTIYLTSETQVQTSDSETEESSCHAPENNLHDSTTYSWPRCPE